ILYRGRQNRADRFWQLNFGLRPVDELYELLTDSDCVRNLAGDPTHAEQLTALRTRMEAELRAQNDPRMFGRGAVFDEYKPAAGDGYYEKFMRGDQVNAGWVSESDFEKEAIKE